MLANQTARITSRRSRFRAEARRKSAETLRQNFAVDNFIAMEIRQRYFRRRCQVVRQTFQFKHVFRELRQLTGADHAVFIDDVRRNDFDKTEFLRVHIQHEIVHRAFQLRACAEVVMEARARDFRRGFRIQNAQTRADVPMGFHFKTEFTRRAITAYFDIIIFIFAHGYARITNVRDFKHLLVKLFFYITQSLIMARDRIADFFHAGDDFRCVAALFFAFGDFLARRVAIGFPLLHFRKQRAAFFIQADNFIHIGVMMTIF